MAVQILDGAIGTELISRGLELEAPEWSAAAIAQAPDLLAQLHADYAWAGATLHTANTFRTQPRAFGEGWVGALRAAVHIARDAVPSEHAVLGSMAPIEDCYRPDLSPGAAARTAHRKIALALVNAGCDVLLCETFANGTESLVAAEEALATGRSSQQKKLWRLACRHGCP
jgi:S-methylmethionine-dependent homocysteine/selenocysteine methylase